MPSSLVLSLSIDRHSDQGTTRTGEEKNTARIYFQSEKRKGTGRQEWRVRWDGGKSAKTEDERKGIDEVQRFPHLANNPPMDFLVGKTVLWLFSHLLCHQYLSTGGLYIHNNKASTHMHKYR